MGKNEFYFLMKLINVLNLPQQRMPEIFVYSGENMH